MTDLQTATDLRATATYLREHGWLQRTLGVDGGPRCVFGALESVTCYVSNRALVAAEALIGWREVVAWNNAPDRTLGEVLDRLESTALGLEVRALAANSAAGSSQIAEPERELVTQPFEV